jgi:adenylate cyclase
LFEPLRRRIRRLPSLPYVLAAETILIALIAAGNALGGTVVWAMGLVPGSFVEAATPPLSVIIYAFIVSAIFVFVMRLRDLIGAQVFLNLLLGRYHRPVHEQRIFLFIDIAGSTAYAETHGDLRAQQYVGAIFAAFAEPVRRHRGEIDDYIGDLAVITWPHARGAQDAACIRCLFAILDEIARNAEDWRKRFGQVPQLRAALHGGSIVTAEIGVDRHKIAYFGDVVNTTARLETLSRHVDASLLISTDLLNRLPPLPPGITARSLGSHAIRGRDQQLAVSALERRDGHHAALAAGQPVATRSSGDQLQPTN